MISALLEAALRALLLALLVGGGLALLRMNNVLAQKLVWGLVLLAAAAMPLAMRWPLGLRVALPALLHRSQLAQPAATTTPTQAAPVVTPDSVKPALLLQQQDVSETPVTAEVPLAEQKPATSPAAQTAEVPAWQMRPATIGCLLYFAVLAGLLTRLMVGLMAALRLWRRATPVPLAQLPLRQTDELAGLCLRASAAVHSPVTVAGGVLLPAGFSAWDAEKLRIALAHEHSHVRQGDFYLQLIAGLYAAIFWFSPLGWWLKRKLSDLSETISDRAGMRIAADGPSYAQVLLEFAALPRPTFTGVAMARTSNLSRRIERLLNEANFRQAFTGGRGRVLAATLLIPVALLAATAVFRVEAAGQNSEQKVVITTAADAQNGSSAPSQTVVTVQDTKAAEGKSADSVGPKQIQLTLSADDAKTKGGAYSLTYVQTADGECSAFETSSSAYPLGFATIHTSGNWNKNCQEEFRKARGSARENFLWFTRNGKSYVVDDPAVTAEIGKMYASTRATVTATMAAAQAQSNSAPVTVLRIDQENAAASARNKKMEEVNQAMTKLQARLGSNSTELAELQQKLGDLQKQMGTLHSQTLTLHSEKNETGQITVEKIEHPAQTGIEIQDRKAIDQQLKLNSIIEQSIKDKKARPVE